jgi:hypothetical protein
MELKIGDDDQINFGGKKNMFGHNSFSAPSFVGSSLSFGEDLGKIGLVLGESESFSTLKEVHSGLSAFSENVFPQLNFFENLNSEFVSIQDLTLNNISSEFKFSGLKNPSSPFISESGRLGISPPLVFDVESSAKLMAQQVTEMKVFVEERMGIVAQMVVDKLIEFGKINSDIKQKGCYCKECGDLLMKVIEMSYFTSLVILCKTCKQKRHVPDEVDIKSI